MADESFSHIRIVCRPEAFVSLDAGLEIASRHARSLGYDAIILFLDELILWLASNAANVDFIAREGPKLSKLIEAERSDRPIPIPVGDLWDAIAAGDQPFSQGMRIQFDNAKKLWTQKLLPTLERRHGVTWQDLMEGTAEPTAAANLRNDARLLKTLLLAALVPEVPALRSLTAARLATLNHGSVVSPIPGREGPTLLQKLRTLAAEIGEIKLSDDANPVISLQITGVDVEPILANAAMEDNEANRRRKIREILFSLPEAPQPNRGVPHVWDAPARVAPPSLRGRQSALRPPAGLRRHGSRCAWPHSGSARSRP